MLPRSNAGRIMMKHINIYDGQKYVATKALRVPEHYNKKEIAGKYDVIRRSIIENGVKSPLIVNQNPDRKNVIIHGVQVFKIAVDLKIDELPVWYLDCKEDQENVYRVLFDQKGTADLTKDEIISLLGDLSYESFFEDDASMSAILEQQFSKTLWESTNGTITEKKSIKQVMLRLSDSQKKQFEEIGKELKADNQTHTLLLLMRFYIEVKEVGND